MAGASALRLEGSVARVTRCGGPNTPTGVACSTRWYPKGVLSRPYLLIQLDCQAYLLNALAAAWRTQGLHHPNQLSMLHALVGDDLQPGYRLSGLGLASAVHELATLPVRSTAYLALRLRYLTLTASRRLHLTVTVRNYWDPPPPSLTPPPPTRSSKTRSVMRKPSPSTSSLHASAAGGSSTSLMQLRTAWVA